MGPETEGQGYSEMPSMIMINNQTLPAKIFGFLSSLAESGLTEVGHYVSVMDI